MSAWSQPAFWRMGLLHATDWKASWITDATTHARTVATRPVNGYHSQFATSPNTPQWIALDLGTPASFDSVRLFPARPFDWQPDSPGLLFPMQFQIEVADHPDFADARVVVDQTGSTVPNPGTNAVLYSFSDTRAQFIRLRVTQLPHRDGTNFAFALAEFLAMVPPQRPRQGGGAHNAAPCRDARGRRHGLHGQSWRGTPNR